MPKTPDPHTLLLAHMKANRLMKHWTLKGLAHLDRGERWKANAALKRAEHWEFEQRKLEAR